MTKLDAIAADGAAIEAVKAYLRITDDGEDEAIAGLIAAAIGHGEQFTGQLFLARAVEETMPAASAWRRLSHGPVRAVSGVAGQAGLDEPYAIAVDGYAIDIDAAGDGWVRTIEPGEATRVTVSYTAGLATEWTGLSEPIRQAAVRLASHLYAHRDAAEEGAPPAAVAALWRPWRRMRLA